MHLKLNIKEQDLILFLDSGEVTYSGNKVKEEAVKGKDIYIMDEVFLTETTAQIASVNK